MIGVVEEQHVTAQAKATVILDSSQRPARKENPNEETLRLFAKYGIVCAPVMAYFLDYRYESGYCSVYQLPLSFIDLNLNTVLLYGTALLAVGGFFAAFYEFWEWRDIPPKTKFDRIYFLYGPYLIFVGLVYVFNGSFTHGTWLWLIVAVLAVVADVVGAALDRDKSKPLVHRLKGVARYLETSYLTQYRGALGAAFPILMALWLLSLISFEMGSGEAYSQENFLVPLGVPKQVVIRKYGDKIITCEIEGSNICTHRFHIYAVTDNYVYKLEKVGELKF